MGNITPVVALGLIDSSQGIVIALLVGFFALVIWGGFKFSKRVHARVKAPGVEAEFDGTNHDPDTKPEGAEGIVAKEITDIKRRLDANDEKATEKRFAAIEESVRLLGQRVGKEAEKANDTVSKLADKANTKLADAEAKWNHRLAGVEASINEIKARLDKLEEAPKSHLPEPIARIAARGILWLKFNESGKFQPYCEACAGKGDRIPITPSKAQSGNNFFMKCSQCPFHTRIGISDHDYYEQGNFYEDEPGPRRLPDWDPHENE